MKTLLLSALGFVSICSMVSAYEVAGSKPIEKLESEVAKVIASKKLICIVYTGRDESCPHCAAAAANGVKAVRGSAECVVIKEAQAKDKSFTAKFTPAVQAVLAKQPTNAWVSFNVFDAEMNTLIASIGRELETDKKATKEFTEKVKAARAALK
ncbi:hypothetical protein [Prosthecobacter sp.]|uniref:hypothetical protein n=1 Tax=Prosthecobacter sp. TaxID=1965333 RepID=UPI001D67AAEE|nr:hypothetical protein [Prosthecobacter sp.]MCB1275532.1 hypothetical protein [Prosthecobacter sp.]